MLSLHASKVFVRLQRQRVLLGDLAYKVDRIARRRLGLAKSCSTLWELRHTAPGDLTLPQSAALQQLETQVKAAGWPVAELTSLQSELKHMRLPDAPEKELYLITAEELKLYADETLADEQLRDATKSLVDLVLELEPGKAPLQ